MLTINPDLPSFSTIQDQDRRLRINAEKLVNEKSAELARERARREHTESLLRRINSELAGNWPVGQLAAVALLLTEHKQAYPEAWR